MEAPQTPAFGRQLREARAVAELPRLALRLPALAREPRLHSLHLAGGEATLRFDLLLDVVRLASRMHLPVAYLETNAHWCRDAEETRSKLLALRDADATMGVFTADHIISPQDRFAAAIRSGLEAAERFPESGPVHSFYGIAAACVGQTALARREIERALEINPNQPILRQTLEQLEADGGN